MDTKLDQSAREAKQRVEDVKESVWARAEQLGRRFQELTGQVDLDARVAAHPWRAVGIAFVLGAVLGARRPRPLVPEMPERGLGAAAVAGLGAIAFRFAKDYAIRRLGSAARTWIVQRTHRDKARPEHASSHEPAVEFFTRD